MPSRESLRFNHAAVGVVLVLTLTACGDDSSDSGATPGAQSAALSGSVPAIALPMVPIDLTQAIAPLTAKPPAVPVCPWLSDASANAAVDVVLSDKPMVRRAVSSQECKWNVNIGFAFSIRAVPLSEAVSPSSVTYNMDVAPIVQPQDGPGSAAVVLSDPTWDAKNPRPFAFIFNADNRQFKIRTTGVKTSSARLRAVADEIASALPDAAPVVETKDVTPTLDPCVYEGAAIAALFGAQQGETLAEEPYLPNSSCKYHGSLGRTRIEVTLVFSGDPLTPSQNMDPEYIEIDGFGTDVYMKDSSSTAGYETSRRAYEIARPGGHIRVFFTVREKTFPESTAEMILNNLIARTK